MTAHTTQSAASSTRPEPQCHRHSCLLRGGAQLTKGLSALARPRLQRMEYTAPSLTIEFLIANLELEFQLTHRKLSPLRISNRKYFAIFYPIFSAYSPLACSEQAHPGRTVPAFLIATVINSEIESSYWKQSTKKNSNSYKTEFSANCPPELAELEAVFFAGFLTACLVTLIAPLSVLLAGGSRKKQREIQRHHHRLRTGG